MKKALTLLPVFLVLIAGVIFSFAEKPIYYRLWYFDNRLTVNCLIKVDGKIAPIDKESVTASEEITVDEINGKTLLSMKGSAYGAHEMKYTVSGIPVCIRLFQWNWWDVQNIDLTVEIDTVNKIIAYSAIHSHLSEDGTEITESYTGETEPYREDAYNCIHLNLW